VPDNPVFVLVAKDTDGSGVEREQPSIRRWKVQPDGSQDSQHVAVSKESNIAIDLRAPVDDSLYAEPNVVHGLPSYNTIAP
jgi:hypothetical protein